MSGQPDLLFNLYRIKREGGMISYRQRKLKKKKVCPEIPSPLAFRTGEGRGKKIFFPRRNNKQRRKKEGRRLVFLAVEKGGGRKKGGA